MIEQDPLQNSSGSPIPSDLGDTFKTPPIGEFLRRQRILRGMSTEELAALTRIPLRSLERLESGQFDGETDGFVRGFVRSVASALGLDADDAISRMLLEPTAHAWERKAAGPGARQILAGLFLILTLVLGLFILRATWNTLFGSTSAPFSRDVVIWRDPVRALSEATDMRLDPLAEINPHTSIEPAAPGSATPRAASAPPTQR
jgi:transcriptional regulator with XRE-family HTH domain